MTKLVDDLPDIKLPRIWWRGRENESSGASALDKI